MVKAKLFVLETAAWGRGSRAVWLPDSKIQAHKANGRWVVQRADFPERAVGAVTDITVSALWASAIETLMAATDTVNAANDHATLLSDDAVPLP